MFWWSMVIGCLVVFVAWLVAKILKTRRIEMEIDAIIATMEKAGKNR